MGKIIVEWLGSREQWTDRRVVSLDTTQEKCQDGLNKTEQYLTYDKTSQLKLKAKCNPVWRQKRYCLGQDTLS